jgi:hypothetical protein
MIHQIQFEFNDQEMDQDEMTLGDYHVRKDATILYGRKMLQT